MLPPDLLKKGGSAPPPNQGTSTRPAEQLDNVRRHGLSSVSDASAATCVQPNSQDFFESIMCFEPSVAQPPLPLQEFFPHSFFDPPPFPLQEFRPRQACFSISFFWAGMMPACEPDDFPVAAKCTRTMPCVLVSVAFSRSRTQLRHRSLQCYDNATDSQPRGEREDLRRPRVFLLCCTAS